MPCGRWTRRTSADVLVGARRLASARSPAPDERVRRGRRFGRPGWVLAPVARRRSWRSPRSPCWRRACCVRTPRCGGSSGRPGCRIRSSRRSSSPSAWSSASVVVGVGLAWLVGAHRFPGRRVLSWALVLPLAMPELHPRLRDDGRVRCRRPGADVVARPVRPRRRGSPRSARCPRAIVTLTLTLYPYVYLLARAALARPGRDGRPRRPHAGRLPRRGDPARRRADAAAGDRRRGGDRRHGDAHRLRHRPVLQPGDGHRRGVPHLARHVRPRRRQRDRHARAGVRRVRHRPRTGPPRPGPLRRVGRRGRPGRAAAPARLAGRRGDAGRHGRRHRRLPRPDGPARDVGRRRAARPAGHADAVALRRLPRQQPHAHRRHRRPSACWRRRSSPTPVASARPASSGSPTASASSATPCPDPSSRWASCSPSSGSTTSSAASAPACPASPPPARSSPSPTPTRSASSPPA